MSPVPTDLLTIAASVLPGVDLGAARSYGWHEVSRVDADTLARAHVWAQLFPVQQLVAAVLNDEPPQILDQFIRGVSKALDGSRQSPP